MLKLNTSKQVPADASKVDENAQMKACAALRRLINYVNYVFGCQGLALGGRKSDEEIFTNFSC